MIKEKNKEDLQKKYLELQILVNQINQIQQQIQIMQNQILELKNLEDNLKRFKEIKENTEAYVPLGLNIFIKAKLADNKEFLVGVGNNALVVKNLEDTLLLIQSQINEVQNIINELEAQFTNLDLNAAKIQEELSGLSNQ